MRLVFKHLQRRTWQQGRFQTTRAFQSQHVLLRNRPLKNKNQAQPPLNPRRSSRGIVTSRPFIPDFKRAKQPFTADLSPLICSAVEWYDIRVTTAQDRHLMLSRYRVLKILLSACQMVKGSWRVVAGNLAETRFVFQDTALEHNEGANPLAIFQVAVYKMLYCLKFLEWWNLSAV